MKSRQIIQSNNKFSIDKFVLQGTEERQAARAECRRTKPKLMQL